MKTFAKIFYLLVITGISLPAMTSEINWDNIKAESITLFYPGQSSWEWLLTKHSAAKSVRKGAPCLECHEDEEADMGKIIVSGKKLEPSPIKGKPGSVKIKLKTAYDKENAYFQVQWKESQFSSGNTGKYKTKVTLMLGDKSVKEYPVAGCWGVCHDDASNMKSFKKGDKKRQLYTSASRVKIKRTGGGDALVDEDALEEMLEEKRFLEYWQHRIDAKSKSNLSHGYILEKRHKLKQTKFNSTSTVKNGIRTVIFSRKRNKNGPGLIPLEEDHQYTLGIALHEDFVSGRQHYVGFGRSFSLGGNDSVITAIKQ